MGQLTQVMVLRFTVAEDTGPTYMQGLQAYLAGTDSISSEAQNTKPALFFSESIHEMVYYWRADSEIGTQRLSVACGLDKSS